MALKVPVAAVHSGFGGGSTNTEATSVVVGSNSSASSGIASSSVTLCGEALGGAGGGVCEAAGAGGAVSTLSSYSEACPSSVNRASALNTLEQRPQRT